MFKHILCPIDGSECALEALDVAAKLASEQNAALTICSVADPSQAAAMAFGDPAMTGACLDALDDEADAVVREAAAREAATIIAHTAALTGQPIPAIVEYAASNGCDLIVMGSHGRGGIQRALVGSVAEGVIRHASVPVLVIRWSQRREKTRQAQAAAATH